MDHQTTMGNIWCNKPPQHKQCHISVDLSLVVHQELKASVTNTTAAVLHKNQNMFVAVCNIPKWITMLTNVNYDKKKDKSKKLELYSVKSKYELLNKLTKFSYLKSNIPQNVPGYHIYNLSEMSTSFLWRILHIGLTIRDTFLLFSIRWHTYPIDILITGIITEKVWWNLS